MVHVWNRMTANCCWGHWEQSAQMYSNARMHKKQLRAQWPLDFEKSFKGLTLKPGSTEWESAWELWQLKGWRVQTAQMFTGFLILVQIEQSTKFLMSSLNLFKAPVAQKMLLCLRQILLQILCLCLRQIFACRWLCTRPQEESDSVNAGNFYLALLVIDLGKGKR